MDISLQSKSLPWPLIFVMFTRSNMTFDKISVLVPTRKRVDRLQAMLASFAETSSGLAELVFRVDEDDTETQSFLRSEAASSIVIVGSRLDGYRSLPTFFNELALVATGDIVMLGNDDMLFPTPQWDRLILEAANKYPDGIFDFGVATQNHTNFPFSIVSKKVVDQLGFLYDPRIFWGDIFLLGVMSAFGRAISLPSVSINHDWMGDHPDGTFAEGEAVRRSNWMEYHQIAVDDAVERLSLDPAVKQLRATPSDVIQRSGWSVVITEAAQ